MTDLGGITRYSCPLPDCGWTHEVPAPGEGATAGIAPAPGAASFEEAMSSVAEQAMLRHVMAVEAVVAEHMNGHTALEYVRALTVVKDDRERLRADRDRLAAKVEALEANYGQVATDAMAHGLCHMTLGGVLNRAEAAEADRDRIAGALARAEAYAHELSHKDATGLLAALDGAGEAS